MFTGMEGRIIGVVGWKDTGKTAVVTGLVEFLKARGYKVGTVKHAHEELAVGVASKDSLRHLEAGATRTATVGTDLVDVMGREGADLDAVLAGHLWLCDYVVVEGFKRAPIPKVAVVADGEAIPEGMEHVVAVVCGKKAPAGLPAFTRECLPDLGAFLFDSGILKHPRRGAALIVNGRPVPMNEFVQGALAGVVKGFIASLHDIEEPASIQLQIKA
jgi:molybdopterin-guanine dinucleotide biosynthesis protein B